MTNTVILVAYAAILLAMSAAAFVLFGRDKRLAAKGTAVRVREKTLLAVTVYGGALGALLGRICFRHKTQKLYFSIVILTALVLQMAVLALLLLVEGGLLP